jgi:hypothetical protein
VDACTKYFLGEPAGTKAGFCKALKKIHHTSRIEIIFMKSRGPVFIVGVGRSGTSLLQSILASHSKISILPETGFLRNACLRRQKSQNISLEQMAASFPRLERVMEKLPEETHPESFPNEIALYHFILERFTAVQDKEIAGDKDPKLVEYISAVAQLFPKAKFIHLVRDPRDVLLSKKKAEWSKGKPSWYHIFANYVQLRLGAYAGEKLSDDQYFLVTYEQILDLPEEYISRVCDFLEVEFESSVLAFQDKARELVADDEMQWKKETMGPLLKNNTGKWKGKLETWEVALTERLCEQAFEVGGYKKSEAVNRLNGIHKLGIYFISYVFKGIGSIYMLYIFIRQN